MATGRAWAEDLPRYKLQVGQELTYRTADDPTAGTEENQTRAKSNWVFTVLRPNADGSRRILFRTKTSFGSSYERNGAGYFDLQPDGRVALNPAVTLDANPTPLFPALPPDAAAIKDGWSSAVALDETKRDYKAPMGPPAADATSWTFEEVTRSVFGPIYELNWHHENEFDLKAGLVRRIKSNYSRSWPNRDKPSVGRAVMELVDERQIESAELAALDAEMTGYFAVCAAYDELMARQDFTRMKDLLDEAESVLRQAEGQFKLPALQAMLKKKLDDHSQSASHQLDSAERFGKLIDKPSEDWQTEDLEGHPRSLADYKGKIVVLDFWYRGCGWCIRAMPQLKQLAREFPAEKVAVLGMNNDRELDDAKYVIDKMELEYETLKNGGHQDGIHAKYGVQGWPTLVLLDGDGIVRHIHVGYSVNLGRDLSDRIRKLLAGNGDKDN